MRWTTFGYHHNWDTKLYDEQMQSPFPDDLSIMCRLFATVLGYCDFKPEAAIVNYYPVGSTLSGHTDHSEPNKSAPLFSLSFGQTAIFLIGGTTLEEKPSAIYLQSGDVLIMSEASRLCYHAVPRIIKTQKLWNSTLTNQDVNDADNGSSLLDMDLFKKVGDSNFWQPFSNYIDDSRININVRQVLNPGDVKLS
ncbi:nucleic acid dioxygenase ALKBH1 isoform X2 [Drosophila gunungcola]|nr:nucleic acid dioxygenase ALKBH1 isoform X2 [Drosophila gunungcola]